MFLKPVRLTKCLIFGVSNSSLSAVLLLDEPERAWELDRETTSNNTMANGQETSDIYKKFTGAASKHRHQTWSLKAESEWLDLPN
jgi:hypothetical protein